MRAVVGYRSLWSCNHSVDCHCLHPHLLQLQLSRQILGPRLSQLQLPSCLGQFCAHNLKSKTKMSICYLGWSGIFCCRYSHRFLCRRFRSHQVFFARAITPSSLTPGVSEVDSESEATRCLGIRVVERARGSPLHVFPMSEVEETTILVRCVACITL